MLLKNLHQVVPSLLLSDKQVIDNILLTQQLLRDLGLLSEIYTEDISSDAALKLGVVTSTVTSLKEQADTALMFHCTSRVQYVSLNGHDDAARFLFCHLDAMESLPADVIDRWKTEFLTVLVPTDPVQADVKQHLTTIPLLLDTKKYLQQQWDASLLPALRDAFNILVTSPEFVSRDSETLLSIVDQLRHRTSHPVRLLLLETKWTGEERTQFAQQVKNLNLEAHTVMTGYLTQAQTMAFYRSADALISLGQGLYDRSSLIMSMIFDVPVIAEAQHDTAYVMGQSGFLLEKSEEQEMSMLYSSLLLTLIQEPSVRRDVIRSQRKNVQRFHASQLTRDLCHCLQLAAIDTPSCLPTVDSMNDWQIDGPFDSSYSLAIVNREVARGLMRLKIPTRMRSLDNATDFAPSEQFLTNNPDCNAMYQHYQRATVLPDVCLRYAYPPYLDDMYGSIRGLHSYGWEETTYPGQYVAAINRKLNLITVPGSSVAKILRENGVRIPIAVTGAGVDHLSHITPVLPVFDDVLKGFCFLHVSSCFPRKGVDVLLKAYGLAFRSHDDVSLIIKTFPNPHNDIAQQLKKIQDADPSYPHVILFEEDITDEQLVGLYQISDAFVAPSRGEGLGLPIAEAMLFGLPVITTGWGGQLDFCNEHTAWLCDYQFAPAGSHLGLSNSAWAEPDAAHLTSLLKEVRYLSEEAREQRALAGQVLIREKFTSDLVAERISMAVEQVKQMPQIRKEPLIGWLSTWNTRCGVAAYSDYLTQTMPTGRVTVFADRTTERTKMDHSAVIRCWDSQLEDSMNDAIAAIRHSGMRALVIQYNFGFFDLLALDRILKAMHASAVHTYLFFHSTASVERDGQLVSLAQIADSLHLAKHIIVHNIDDMNRLKSYGIVANTTLFPQGVLHAPVLTKPAVNQAKNRKVIASYGFLFPHKGMQLLITAFAELVKNYPDMELLLLTAKHPIIDSAQEMEACIQLIAQYQLQDKVRLVCDFLPEHECLARLQEADLIVYPYQHTNESSSAAVRMGLATGVPVAVTPISIFNDVRSAVYTMSGTDANAIRESVEAILFDSNELADYAQRAEQWCNDRRWPVLAERLLNMIDGNANEIFKPYI